MRKNILIVDDEKSICTFLALALEDEYEVFTAESPEQAYDILEKEKINLVISMCQDGFLSYSIDEAMEFFDAWSQDGYPAMSHSETYRQAEHPAYRIVRKSLLNADIT